MRLNYKRLGAYIEPVQKFNDGLEVSELLGISNNKYFQKSHTNTIGIDLTSYRIVRNGQFAFNRATTRNGDKISIALREGGDCIVSPSYRIFRSKDENKLNSEYLMMWFRRPEFDRYARFKSHGSAHEFFDLDEMYDVQLPIPSIEKQREIVAEYNTIQNRIKLNETLIQKLEETAQAIYREWFVEGIDLENLPEGWRKDKLKNLCSKIGSGSTPTGGKESYSNSGISLIRSTNVFDYNFSFEDLAFISDEQANKLKNVEIKENDILFNITGVSVARCCMVPKHILPARVNQHVMIIRPKGDHYLSYYLLLNLCSTDSKNTLLGISQSGSTREAITKTEIEEFEMIVPKSEILLKFENHMHKIFSIKDLKSFENQKLIELKELLLSRLATVEN